MGNSVFNLTLDIHALGSPAAINVQQGDTWRRIVITLMESGVPYNIAPGCYAVFAGKKPDGKTLFNSCTIDGNTIIYELTKQTTAVAGLVPSQIRLYSKDGKVLSTPDFSLFVDAGAVTDEDIVIESMSEVTALTELLNEVRALVADMDKLKDQNIEAIIREIVKEEHLETIVQEMIKEDHIATIVQGIIKDYEFETLVKEIIKEEKTEVIIQEIIKEEHVETIVQEILQPEHTETIIQEIIKPGNVETIVQEIIKEEHVETIVQEILQPENTHTIVQEVLKPENTTVIVEQVMEEIPGNITVEVDTDTMTANYTNTQIIEHLENGGTARVKVSSSGAYFQLYGIVGTTVMFGAPAVNEAEQVELVIYSFWASGSVSKDVFPIGSGEFAGKPISGFKITEGENGAFSMDIKFTDGSSDTFSVPGGDKPESVTYNGVAIPIEWAVSG